ncbi:bile acid-CoA:amino acid N-acyltransferase-like isoform X1 [Mizuhopecten yessoensis]|uniref:bile acid-CoA:amino acid N-acyltransferase-like isoform X1 n=1 Tax=Mizuhopecten yessoensis TaxID=6573 RepID=UPI000B457A99|nr:bile acid-CoA:amino acid N-acyltransferase-like isoform X1 [Mizuhopecten yessoensis]
MKMFRILALLKEPVNFGSKLGSFGIRCLNTRSMEGMKLSVHPHEVMVDERVSVQVSGLAANQRVTVYSSIKSGKGEVFASCGCYQAEKDGTVDLERTPALSGTYTGTDGMGFIWSMRPAPGQRSGLRLVQTDVTKPQLVNISIHSGHHSLSDLCKGHSNPPLVTGVLPRWYKSCDVSRIPVTSGRLRGTLFLPKGPGPFPGLIDMYGTGGGIMEYRAALLASRGFAVLALPFFGYQDLQKSFSDLDLNYFKEAVTFLDTHTHVQSGGLGIIAISKGAELGQFIAIHCPVIKAIVSINGMPYLSFSPIHDGHITYPNAIELDLALYDHTEEGICSKTGHCFDTSKFFKVWESDVKILSIIGSDDMNVHPDLHQLQVGCFPAHKQNNIELVVYEGAGHLIEPPFSPHCRASYIKMLGTNLVWGGNPVDHAYAQEDSWRRILHFLNKHLREGHRKEGIKSLL